LHVEQSLDNRSYHVCSDLIKYELNFIPRRGIEKAILDLALAIESGEIVEPLTNPQYSNIKVLQQRGFS